MSHSTIRISESNKRILKSMADHEGVSLQKILDQVIESYRRQYFLEKVNQDYAALKNQPKAWQDLLSERESWDVTLLDGLENAQEAQW